MAGKTKLELGKKDDGLLLTQEEFAEADFEEPWRYERVKGRLVVMAPEGQDHIVAGQPFLVELCAYRKSHPEIVEFVVPQAWVRPDEDTDRMGDIGVFLVSKRAQPKIPDRVPEIVIEVVSKGKRDRKRDYEEKREEYHRLGVKEYVIVDRFEHRVTVLEWKKDGYTERVLGPEESYTTRLLPGLSIPLNTIIE